MKNKCLTLSDESYYFVMKVTFIFDIHVKKYKGKLPPISWAFLKAAVS